MFENFDKYVKYVAYTSLYNRFKDVIKEYGVERPSISSLMRNMDEAYHRLQSSALAPMSVSVSDSLDAIARKQVHYRYVVHYRKYLELARLQFYNALDKLNRPSLCTVYKSFDKIIESVKSDLLYVP